MPILAPWKLFIDLIVDLETDQPGVYELGNRESQVIYIGSSGQIRTRLLEHVKTYRPACIKTNAVVYRVEYRANRMARERELYDEFLSVNRRAPRCNDTTP
ncbi:MAG TPA: GIY-YIG nuclease family protein [Candidatus Eisenbacteria bacterium]|nr:GIY-YIG nuclease family protein [Candidatus Eisenbacteria bacterium]